MDELIVPKIGYPHARALVSYDDLVNNSKTESFSLLINGGLDNLYQQENINVLMEKITGEGFTPHLH